MLSPIRTLHAARSVLGKPGPRPPRHHVAAVVVLAGVTFGSLTAAGARAVGETSSPSASATPAAAESPQAAPTTDRVDPELSAAPATDVAVPGASPATAAPAATSPAGGSPTDIPLSSVSGPAGPYNRYGIPIVPMAAYQRAAGRLGGCGIPWWLLAGIGQVESGHAAGGRVDSTGRVRGAIYGPRLDGSLAGTAVMADTDGGAVDADPAFDRAVGPMQFLPATWSWAGRDGNGDGRADPQNVYDAALAAGSYLCRFGSLSSEEAQGRALLSYNGSPAYVRSVLEAAQAYHELADPSAKPGATSSPTTTSAPAPSPVRPPAAPAPAPAPAPTPAPSPATVPAPAPLSTPAPTLRPTTTTTPAEATATST